MYTMRASRDLYDPAGVSIFIPAPGCRLALGAPYVQSAKVEGATEPGTT